MPDRGLNQSVIKLDHMDSGHIHRTTRKKTSADFKNGINDLVESLGVGGETRVRDYFKAYKKLENKKDKGRTPLTKEET